MPDTSGGDEAIHDEPTQRAPTQVEPRNNGGTSGGADLRASLRIIVIALILVLLMGGLIRLGLGRLPKAPEVVKLGLIAPFEGPSRPLGYAVLEAVRLRLQRWNEGGGVPRVELVALNDDGDPNLAARLPGQLALDPDVLLVLGPPQGHTALAALPGFQAHALPAISLAPLPDPGPQGRSGGAVAPFAGTAETVRLALADQAPGAVVAWQAPITTTSIWVGDPQTLADQRRSHPGLVPAAGAVAAEEAFAAWAGAAGDGLVWATAYPESLPADVASALGHSANAQAIDLPPDPIAALAYAATDEALKLLSLHRSRSGILAALDGIDLPSMRLFVRQGDRPGAPGTCCLPLSRQP